MTDHGGGHEPRDEEPIWRRPDHEADDDGLDRNGARTQSFRPDGGAAGHDTQAYARPSSDRSSADLSPYSPSPYGTQQYEPPPAPPVSYGPTYGPSYGGQSAGPPSYGSAGYGSTGYGQPDYARAPYSQPGYAQPGYAQPGYPQPDYSQSGYPQPGYAQYGYAQPSYAQPSYVPPPDGQQPMHKSRKGLWISLVVAVVVIAVAGAVLLVTGLIAGDRRLSHSAVEATIAGQTGATNVTCNGGEDFTMTRNGARFSCTADGGKRFTVVIENKRDGDYTYEGSN